MFETDEVKKEITYTETWCIEDVDLAAQDNDIDISFLDAADKWEVLKAAMDTAEFYETALSRDIIVDEIRVMVEERGLNQ